MWKWSQLWPNDQSQSKLLLTRTHPDWGNLYKMTCICLVCKRDRARGHGPQLRVDTLPALPLPLPTILISRECFFLTRWNTVDSWLKKFPDGTKRLFVSSPNRKLGRETLTNYRAKFKHFAQCFATSLPALTCYDLCVILAVIFNWARGSYAQNSPGGSRLVPVGHLILSHMTWRNCQHLPPQMMLDEVADRLTPLWGLSSLDELSWGQQPTSATPRCPQMNGCCQREQRYHYSLLLLDYNQTVQSCLWRL